MKNSFEGLEIAWKEFLQPAPIVASPFIGVGVGAKTKKPQVAQASEIIL